MAQADGPPFDGVYIPAALLRRPAPGEALVPFVVEGRFRAGQPCREASPVVWRCLARHGLRILGPPPAELGIADDDETLCAHQIANLSGYWSDWIGQAQSALAAKASNEDCSAAALRWGVLSVSRVACTIATGAIVSKGEAGLNAMRSYPASWHGLIEGALTSHRGGPERVPVATLSAALDYMRFVIMQASRYQL